MADKAVNVALVGCGAISELYYAPCLRELEARGEVRVVAVADPNAARRQALRAFFASAVETAQAADALAYKPELAIVASPPKFHAEQSICFLEKGCAVLCEKPMAATLGEAEKMAQVAERTGSLLAVGLFRRFYPSSEAIREIVRNENFGKIGAIEVTEGGPFNWPAASASFFKKSDSQGGVLADLGVHVLDLLIWWFGYPEEFDYVDDAMGGLEANCVVTMRFANGIKGRVRLSRDTKIKTGFILRAEKGTVVWQGGDPNKMKITFPGGPWELDAQLTSHSDMWTSPGYKESFARQLWSVLQCVRGKEPPRISGRDGLLSLKLIEQCYASRRLMDQPWLSASEKEAASK